MSYFSSTGRPLLRSVAFTAVAVAAVAHPLLLRPLTAGPASPQTTDADEALVFSPLHVPGSTATVARGINALGQIVGSYMDERGTHGFLLRNGVFSTIDVPGGNSTIASGINNAGQIVGAYGDGADSGNHGFLLRDAALTTLDVPGSLDTRAGGLNNRGLIVGTYLGVDGHRHGFSFSDGIFTTVDAPRAHDTFASAVDDAGRIVGRSSDGVTTSGFLRSGGRFATIAPSPRRYADARAIDNAGDVAGQDGDPATPFRGFLRRGGVFVPVPIQWTPSSWNVQGLNDLGQLVGEYHDDAGVHGYVATPAALRDAFNYTAVVPGHVAGPDAALPAAVPTSVPAALPTALPTATPPQLVPSAERPSVGVATLSPDGDSRGDVRWITSIGVPAQVSFVVSRHGGVTSGEVTVHNHDGISFTGTISCYIQQTPTSAWFAGTIVKYEGTDIPPNRQGTGTFRVAIDDRSAVGGRDQVGVNRARAPYECTGVMRAGRPVTDGDLVSRAAH
jgi:uncharacterized membrane protein